LDFHRPTIDLLYSCPQAGRPRHRNAAAPGLISLRSITPAKAAYAATGIIFSCINQSHNSLIFIPPHENCVKKIEAPPLTPLPNWGGEGGGARSEATSFRSLANDEDF